MVFSRRSVVRSPVVPSSNKLAILHVALNPVTGVWSVMRELAKAQAGSGLYATVGIGIIADSAWPALCVEELHSSGLPNYMASTPKMFGTAQFLWQRLQRPPLEKWIDDLLARSGARCCIVHFHNAWLSGVFLPLAQVKQGRAWALATFHGVNAHFREQPVRRTIHRWMAARLPRHRASLTSVDRANLERARDVLGMDPSLFKVVPNGIPDTVSRGCPNLNGGTVFTLGHIGSIMPAKGWRILVAAAAHLREQGYPIQVILAGRGPEAGQARELSESSGGWVTYWGFVANPRETVMRELDVLVLMSEQEGLPMAIIEALSLGVPVIATPVGGIPEAVADGVNGFLVPRTVEALTAALAKLIRNRDMRRGMGREARRSFEESFEISRIVSQYHRIYQEAL